jgi:hypothetical protein
MNVADVYSHRCYNPDYDVATGYLTRAMLHVPLFLSTDARMCV